MAMASATFNSSTASSSVLFFSSPCDNNLQVNTSRQSAKLIARVNRNLLVLGVSKRNSSIKSQQDYDSVNRHASFSGIVAKCTGYRNGIAGLLPGRDVTCKSSSDLVSNVASTETFATGGGDNNGGAGGGEGGGGGGGGDGGEGEGDAAKNKAEALAALAALGKGLESLPKDMAQAITEGRIPAVIVKRFADLENKFFIGWLMKFGGFKERLLADDLFLTKVAIECGVGVFTKTAAEIERRREKFWKEFDFVVADVIMAVIADFMLVWLPAPTVSLRPALNKSAGKLAQFFFNCPDNAFQVALRGTNYTILQRLAAIVRNGSKLLLVGTTASLFGTAATNGLSAVRKSVDKDYVVVAEETEVPILRTSVAYGVYMSISSNLRYQVLAGVVEQRLLEPLLHDKKLALSALSFVVRTGNTFLGSLMWVDYARWVGVQ